MNNLFRNIALIALILVSAECFLRLIDYRSLKYKDLEVKLAKANELNQRLKDFNLNRELTVNELMVIHVPDKSGNYFGRTRSFLVPVHGIKSYPIPDDCDELVGIRKAIAEYLKDVKKEN